MKADGERFARRLTNVPAVVQRHVRPALEKSAAEMVAAMRQLAPDWLAPSIKWTWGEAPAGAFTLHALGGAESGNLRITIYSADFRARWFEFGTGDRYQKSTGRYTGRITATPFFWPGFRLVQKRAQRRIAAAVSRAVREAMRA
jgi:hypothetical protein